MLLPRSARSVLTAVTVAAVGAGVALGAALADGGSAQSTSDPSSPPATSRTGAGDGTICGTYCDGTPAAPAAPYREADSAGIQGRLVRLSIDDTDRTAFADISNGDPADEVWVDRSWDGGRSWDGKLGRTGIPRAGVTATTTQWNLQRDAATSVVRACGRWASARRSPARTGMRPGRSRRPARAGPGAPWTP